MNQISPTLSPSHTHWHTSTSMNNNDHQKQPLSLFFSLNHFPQNDDVSDNSSTSIDNPSETSSSHPHHHHHHLLSNSDQQRQPMFEKPLTPSDVGKLNRLVIPKQFAEKFFPLAGATGLLLGFEDDTGKSWRFRYSYWNSSQSYVLTKGWSRYVKEKKLDAGDVVLFDRHQSEPDRFFIGCRRRRSGFPVRTGGGQFSSLLSTPNAVRVQQSYPTPQPHRITANYFHAGTRKNGERLEGVNSKRVRLFGVNLECQLEEEDDIKPQTSDGSFLSSQGPSQGFGLGLDMGSGPINYKYLGYSGYVFNHQDINSPQDFNQMRNRPG